MAKLKPCPFCGGKAKISFKDYCFYGKNLEGDRKVSYRVQAICNKCKSRGRPIITEPMINPYPYITEWGNCYGASDRAKTETERFRPYVEKAVEAWNTRTPAADVVEVKHAKFELVDSGKGACSNCHRLDSIDKLAKYCRYCGAKMDESATDIYVGS